MEEGSTLQSPEAEREQPLDDMAQADTVLPTADDAAPAAAPTIRTRVRRIATALPVAADDIVAANGHVAVDIPTTSGDFVVAAELAADDVATTVAPLPLRTRLRRPPTGAVAAVLPAKPKSALLRFLDWTLDHRGFWLSLVAIVFAYLGQNIFNSFNGEYVEDYGRAPLFYLIGAGLLIVALSFTYRTHLFFRVGPYQSPDPDVPRRSNNVFRALGNVWRNHPPGFGLLFRIPWWRYVLLAAAIFCAVAGVQRWKNAPQNVPNPNDISAILYWAASILLLVLAVAWQKFDRWPLHAQNPDEYANTVVDEDGRSGDEGWAFANRRLEVGLVIVLMLAAAFLRLYNLGSIPTGIHGDEAELTMLSRRLLAGDFGGLPLLGPGAWYHVPAMVSYLVAPGLALFGGESVFGMRFTTAVFGIATCFFMYLLLRLLFKGRTALIGLGLIAVLDVHIQFSHYTQGAEQIATCLAAMFYFLFKGLRTKRYLDFVWAGLAGGFGGLYSYPSGRIALVLLAGVIGFLIIRRWSFLRDYWSHVTACLLAVLIVGAPILFFSVQDPNAVNDRLRDVYITYGGAARDTFGRWNVPLPKEPPYEGGASPISVEAFSSVLRNWNDGWSQVIWKQSKVTYLTLTAVHDRIYFYETGKPLLNPIQAILTVLGLAYFLWRWRDPRYMLFNIWFWPAMFVAVAMTVSAPDVLRMAGLPPAWVAFPAVLINKLAYEAEKTGWFIRPELREWMRRRRYSLRQMLNFAPQPQLAGANNIPVSSIDNMIRSVMGNVAGYRPAKAEPLITSRVPVRLVHPPRTGVPLLNVIILLLVLFIALQNTTNYFNTYGKGNHFTGITTPAKYIEQLGSSYYVNYLGMHLFYFNHSDIRFLAPDVKGQDYFNAPDQLPMRGTGDKNLAFLVFPVHGAFMPIIQSYYPNGTTVPVNFPDAGLAFTNYAVPAAQVQATRALTATYYGGTNLDDNPGPALRNTASYSLTNAPHNPPQNLNYPAQIRWEGQIYAPIYGAYQLELSSRDKNGTAAPATLYLDDQQWMSIAAPQPLTSTKLIMAQGWHRISLRAALPTADQRISLRWALPSGKVGDISPEYIYNGPLSDAQYGLLGEVSFNNQPVSARRVDPFIGFMDTYGLVHNEGNAFDVTWTGSLNINFDDTYNFMMTCEGPTTVTLDDQPILQGCPSAGGEQTFPGGNIDLKAGPHSIKVSYHWERDFGSIKLYWSAANQHINQQLIPPTALRPGKTIWRTNELAGATGSVPPEIGNNPTPFSPISVIPPSGNSGSAAFSVPQGMASDAQGNIYVGQAKPPRIVKLDKAGKQLAAWDVLAGNADGEAALADLASDAHGNIYALNPNTKGLEVYDSNGKLLGIRNVKNKFLAYAPSGLSTDKQGNVYIADTGSSRILEIDASDNLVREIGGGQAFPALNGKQDPKRTYQPIDLTVTDDGNIYVVDLNQRIINYAPDGKYVREWRIPNLGGGEGSMHMASFGKYVYLSDTHAAGIYVLDTSGDGLFTLYGGSGDAPGQFSNPAGLAVDPSGQLYVADRGNARVQVFAPLQP